MKDCASGSSARFLANLISVSKGEKGADFIFRNGRILNVYTGEILPGNIATFGNRIAYVGSSERMVDSRTRVVDAGGAYCLPGFIDAHCHPDLFSNPAAFCDSVVQHGTTTIAIDAQDMCNAFGMAGFREVYSDSLSYPVRSFFLVPAVSPPFPEIEGGELFTSEETVGLLKMERVIGLAEVTSYPRILRGDKSLLTTLAAAKRAAKSVEGHTTGASYDKLNALVAGGLTSCHESISPEDVLNRLRVGLYTMVRCGSIRCELERLTPTLSDPMVSHSNRVILTPDGVFPENIIRTGHMNHVARKAIEFGLESIRAIQMCTINPASYLKRDYDLGAIAPGRFADIQIVDDLKGLHVETVMSNGRLLVSGGKPLFAPSPVPRIRDEGKPFAMSGFSRELFRVKAPKDRSRGIPVALISGKTITRRVDLQLPIKDDLVESNPGEDVFKAAVLLRNGRQYNCGFVKGLNLGVDAFAMSACHEHQEMVIVGRDDGAMKVALQRLVEIKGGIVIANDGVTIHELGLPIGGTMSAKSLDETAKDLALIKEILRAHGCTLDDPLWTVGFIPFSALPELRVTVSGVYDVKKGKIVFDAFHPLY